MDHADKNDAAMKELKKKNLANLSFGPCHSHTINFPGKEFSKSCKEMHDFRTHWNTGIQTCGKMHNTVKGVILRSPVISGGVHWYIQWEQIAELNNIDIERIMNELVPLLEKSKLSEELVKNMTMIATSLNLLEIMVQMAITAEVSKPFYEATYILEGDEPLGVICWVVFENLDRCIEDGVNLNEKTVNICDRAAELVQVVRSRLQEEKLEIVNTAQGAASNYHLELNQLKTALGNAEVHAARRGGRQRHPNYQRLNNGQEQIEEEEEEVLSVDDIKSSIDERKRTEQL
eukprot:9719094-Ditylum_brightwellii.AAC.1